MNASSDTTTPHSADGAGASPAAEASPLRRHLSGYTDRTGVVLFITLATLAAAPPPQTFHLTRLVALVGLLLLPFVRDRATFWFALAALAAAGTLRQSVLQLDNHHFLQLYWLLAVALSRLGDDPRRTLAVTGRLLVGIVFLFATLWKLVSPDFADGGLLGYAAAIDPGANVIPIALGLQPAEVVEANIAAASEIGALGRELPGEPADLTLDPRIERTLVPFAIATIVLEGLIAASFLLPLPRRIRWLRDASVLTFLLTTYLVLPVVGFAWLIIGMSLAQSDLDDDRGSALYLAALSLIAAFAARGQIIALLGLPTA